jgi:hypothetical protein
MKRKENLEKEPPRLESVVEPFNQTQAYINSKLSIVLNLLFPSQIHLIFPEWAEHTGNSTVKFKTH